RLAPTGVAPRAQALLLRRFKPLLAARRARKAAPCAGHCSQVDFC
ncbi:hypothetical protein A2U01_0085699, partial [Trifolium medium]|nr:hypothetical protein [Trifolium medium]